MPRILAVSRALPGHAVAQTEVRALVERLFAGDDADLAPFTVFDHSRIEWRQFVMPLEWYTIPHPPAERNRIFQSVGVELLVRAVADCLDQADCPATAIDQIILVNSTGLATPTLDAQLFPHCGFKPSTSRLPIWGLGCAGGASGLSRAHDYCLAHPRSRVLLLALECCSLTFAADDRSRKNLIATSLFGDGCAVALIVGDQAASAGGVEIVATRSQLYPETLRIMGWDIGDRGMELVLSPRLPLLVREALGPLIDTFLREEGRSRGDLVHYLTHPGGARVLDAYRDALDLDDAQLALSAAILRDHGNVSSVTILLVLAAWLARCPAPGTGLISAFGPGFSAELLLVEA